MRFPILALGAVLAVLAFGAPAQAQTQTQTTQSGKPQANPLTRVPYEYNEEAPPRVVGAILGFGLLILVIGGVSYGIRRKNRRERDRRWRAALPESIVDPDPWLERDGVTEGKAIVRDLDAAWAADDDAALQRLVAPGLLRRWAVVRAVERHRRIDEYAPIRVDYVTALHPQDGEDARVVVRVEARVRDVGDLAPSTVSGRLAARAGGQGSDRGMSPAEGHA